MSRMTDLLPVQQPVGQLTRTIDTDGVSDGDTEPNCNSRTADYVLNGFNLLKRKLAHVDPLRYEIKSNNVVLELSTAAFEVVRKAMIQRFNHYPAGRANTYHCSISVKTDSNNVHVIESETVKVHQGRQKSSTYQVQKHVFTMNIYRTTNKILVNGPNIETFLADEMPLISELIESRLDSIGLADAELRDRLLPLSETEHIYTTSCTRKQEDKCPSPQRSVGDMYHNDACDVVSNNTCDVSDNEITFKGPTTVPETTQISGENDSAKVETSVMKCNVKSNDTFQDELTLVKQIAQEADHMTQSQKSHETSEPGGLTSTAPQQKGDPPSVADLAQHERASNIPRTPPDENHDLVSEDVNNNSTAMGDMTQSNPSQDKPNVTVKAVSHESALDQIPDGIDHFHKIDARMVEILDKVSGIADRVDKLEGRGEHKCQIPSDLNHITTILKRLENQHPQTTMAPELQPSIARSHPQEEPSKISVAHNSTEVMCNLIEKALAPPLRKLSAGVAMIPEATESVLATMTSIKNAIDNLSCALLTSTSKSTDAIDRVYSELGKLTEISVDHTKSLSFTLSEMCDKMKVQGPIVTPVSAPPTDLEPVNPEQQSMVQVPLKYFLVQGPKDPLSNFFLCPLEDNSQGRSTTFRSAEHCLQYKKAQFLATIQPEICKGIFQAKTGASAKYLGNKLNSHPKIGEWRKQELFVLRGILMRKARCCPAFNKKLIESGRAALYHSVSDIYWGIGIDTNEVEHPLRPENIAGENRHGKLLMEIRDTLLMQGLQEQDSDTNVTSQVVWNTAVKQTLSLKETLQAPIREQVSHDQGDGIASRGNYVESRTDSALLAQDNRPASQGKGGRSAVQGREATSKGRDQRGRNQDRGQRFAHRNSYLNSERHGQQPSAADKVQPLDNSESPHNKHRVLIVGNSLLKGIKEQALSRHCDVTKINAANISAVSKELLQYEGDAPDCIVIQAITNEARRFAENSETDSSRETSQEYDVTLDIINSKWPECKPIICLAPPRADGVALTIVQNIINNTLKLLLHKKAIAYVTFDHLGYNGFPNETYYSDHVHLNKTGTSIYAARMKKIIHKVLNVH